MQSSSLLLKICGHLLRYFTKISPRRAKSTPAGNFCSCLVSASPIFKRLTQKGFSEAARMPLVPRGSDVFAAQKLASRSVHGCTLLDRLFAKGGRQKSLHCLLPWMVVMLGKTCLSAKTSSKRINEDIQSLLFIRNRSFKERLYIFDIRKRKGLTKKEF